MNLTDLTFYYPELATLACADPTRVLLETSMDQFIFKHSFLILNYTDLCCCSIDKTSRIAAAWSLLLVWSCTFVGFAEAAFRIHTGTMIQGSGDGSGVSTTDRYLLIFRSSLQSLSYGESGTSQIDLSLSYKNTSGTLPTRAQSEQLSALSLAPLSAFWKSWAVIGRRSWRRFVCLLLTHQLLILSKIPIYTEQFWLESRTRVISTLLHSLNYRV